MNKFYALSLCTFLLTGCATTSQVSTLPSDVYVATSDAPTYYSPNQSSSRTGYSFAQNELIHVVRRKKPNWIAFSYQNRTIYILEGFTSPTLVTPSAPRYSTTPSPTYSYPTPSSNSRGSSHNIQTGPRGGQYYINGNGNKTYIKRK
jgi:hypothetical protein